MSGIQTNRDLYLAIADLTESHRSGTRDLEEYLRALWGEARRFRERASLSGDEFFGLLSAAFTLPDAAFQEAWRSRYPGDDMNPLAACLAAKMGVRQGSSGSNDSRAPAFDSWESFLLRQIVDLREMAEQGMLADEQRYFGIDSPRGQRWYNFDPCTFLECATAGSYGGWQSGDDTGREYVPEPTAEELPCPDCGRLTLHEFANGPYCSACAEYVDKELVQKIAAARLNELQTEPGDVRDRVVSIPEMSWDDFRSFLGCGQWYE